MHNVDRYVQYDTIWILQSIYGTVFDASPYTLLDPIIFKNESGRLFQCSNSPMYCLLFQKFVVGLLRGMVKFVYQNVAISAHVLKEILEKYEADLLDSTLTWLIKRKLIICGSVYVILFE